MVEIDAYAADCPVHGQVEVGEGRLSDQLNRTPDLLIRDARLEGLDDGQLVDMSEVTIARDELCAVVVSGPRGDVARRLHTRTTHVEVEVGPYLVEGRVHGTPASEPLADFLRQVAWVPQTEATVRWGGALLFFHPPPGALLPRGKRGPSQFSVDRPPNAKDRGARCDLLDC